MKSKPMLKSKRSKMRQAAWNKITHAQGYAILITLAEGLTTIRTLDKGQKKMVTDFMVTLIRDETDIEQVKAQLQTAGKEEELKIFSESLVEFLLQTR